ncbi:MAG: NAD-dependent epimerase/dehydratase family protein [Cellulosilyticaceae bacterium]
MKILITGKDSYIGTSFEKWVEQYGDDYIVDTIDVKDDSWKEKSFIGYDAILHVAGIAHVNAKKVDDSLYYKINRDLAVNLAKKAKNEGVKQFVFLSSMAIYGLEGKIGKQIVIDKNTKYNPMNAYGKSKLEADELIIELSDSTFTTSIVRPPMVYGPKCVGNYTILSKMVQKVRVFPAIDNQRSMIYIDNLSEVLKQIIEEKEQGIFHPQNTEYVSTRQMVRYIAEARGIKIYESWLMALGVKLVGRYISLCGKVFGNLTYEHDLMCVVKETSKEIKLKESIYMAERQ